MSLGTDRNSGQRLTTDGPGEFWCPACGARCTESPDGTTEYGHQLDCPNRELPRFGELPSSRTTQLQNCLDADLATDGGSEADK